jgi:hypothetical protein
MGAYKNSIQEFNLGTRFHSCTSASFSCQVHVATEVLLNSHSTHTAETHTTRLLAAQTGQVGF